MNLLTRHFSDRLFVRLYFLRYERKILHLKNPKTLWEKIQWLKLYGNLGSYAEYVDKVEAREFVRQTVGPQYLVPIVGVWDRFEDIPFAKLPERFALKATHGCGYNFICRDKTELDWAKLKVLVDKWLGEKFYAIMREPQYRLCKPRIICEEYLEDNSGTLIDYKVFCFDGRPTIIQVISDRQGDQRMDFFDLQWNRLHIKGPRPNSTKAPARPDCLEELLSVAEKLTRSFPFVRADFYCVRGKVYFGELTFTPGNGIGKYRPRKVNYDLGVLLDLTRYQSSDPEGYS